MITMNMVTVNEEDDDDLGDDDRVIKSVDDLGDSKDNTTRMLVQPRTESHLLLRRSRHISLGVHVDVDDGPVTPFMMFCSVIHHLCETHDETKVLGPYFWVVLEEATQETKFHALKNSVLCNKWVTARQQYSQLAVSIERT